MAQPGPSFSPRLLVVLAVATTLAAAGCGHSGATSGPAADEGRKAGAAPAATSTPSGGAPDLGYHMQASFWGAVAARDAVIAGDLQAAREHSAKLSQERFEVLPERWKHWIAEMQKNAGDAATAADINETAHWVASLGVTCGNCHWYSGEGPKFGAQHGAETAAEPESIEDRMKRHAHAADDLWTGLVMPSEQAWKRGAKRLAEAPPERPLREGEEVNAHFAEALNQIKALGLRAQLVRTPHQRAEVYGELISRCAHCHAVVPRKP